MGELLKTLGLGGGVKPPMTTPGIGGGLPGGPGLEPMAGEEGGVTVTGDAWKPRKPTILGALADGFLMSRGMKPAFSINRDARNVQEAMSEYTQDPQNAIRRLNMIKGQQGTAAELQNQHLDNERADITAQSVADARKEKFFPRVGGMLMAIGRNKDPDATYQTQKPVIQQYIDARGLTNDIKLPDKWDEDAIQSIIMGNVSPEDQYKQELLAEHRRNRLALDRDKANDLSGYREDRLEDFDLNRESQDRRAAVAEEGRNNRSKNNPRNEPRFIKTPQGHMELSPSGNLGKIGDQIWQKVAPGRWERVK